MTYLDRPRQFRTPGEVVDTVRNGRWFDRSLDALEEAIADRRKAIHAELEAKVKEVYGPEATIVLPKPPVYRGGTLECGALDGGVATCGPAADCPHGGAR